MSLRIMPRRIRRPADARIVYIPLKTKSRAGVEYTHYKPYLQHLK